MFLSLAPTTSSAQDTIPNLFEYPQTPGLIDEYRGLVDRYRAQQAVTDVDVVRIHSSNLSPAGPINLNLPRSPEPILLDNVRVAQREDGTYSWFGHPTASASTGTTAIILVQGEGAIAGVIRTDTQLYRVRSVDNDTQLLVAIDAAARLPRDDHPPEFQEHLYDNPQQGDTRDFDAGALPDSCDTVRLLVAYTSQAQREAADSYGSITDVIEIALSQANDGYHQSGVPLRLELAHAYHTDYSETYLADDLYQFRVDSDSVMDDVHRLRDTHRADVAVLLRRSAGPVECGLGAKIGATASTAFAVVAQTCAVDDFSLAHEIGHLHGARHNPAADWNNWPFAYGHGYHSRAKKTIMARTCPGVYGSCQRQNYWSSPNVVLDGRPMGTARHHDNARVLRETACRVANFR